MYGSVGCASAAFFFFWLTIVILVVTRPSSKAKNAAVAFHVLSAIFCFLLLATVQSFQLLPFWATGLMSIAPAAISGMFLTVLSSENFFVLFRREESGQSSDTTELLPYYEHSALNRMSKLSVGRLTLFSTTISAHKGRLVLIITLLLFCSVLLTAGTYGGCGCEHPVVFTTSFSRLFSPGTCLPDRMCHIYAQPGASASSLALVFHYVVGWQTSIIPTAAFGMVCDAATNCLSSTTRQGRLVDNADVWEDRRFVGHVLFSDLTPDVLYAFSGIFLMSDGSNRSVRQLFRTLPSSGNVSVVAGGDYESSGLGHKLLILGFAASNNDARMIYIGGDIAYENNMRYCYRRLDSVIDDLTELRRNDGSQPLLLTATGNHEAGGWLLATTEEERRSFISFYPKYFPSIDTQAYSNTLSYLDESTFYVDGRITSTFHAHQIGGAFWMILDSNTINDVKAQVGFLTTNLESWKQQIDANTTTATKIVVTYHACIPFSNDARRQTNRCAAEVNYSGTRCVCAVCDMGHGTPRSYIQANKVCT